MSDAAATEAKMIENLKATTGRGIEEWVEIARAAGMSKHGEIVAHLKACHGLGHGYANLVVHRLLKSAAADADPGDLIAAQYSGTKAGLRPVYDSLARALSTLGPDVELAPKKAYVSVRAAKQFAILQPSTATRLDVGINLKGVPAGGRLEASGSFNAMVSHRVRVGSAAEVDGELLGWLRRAYDAAH